MLFSRSAKSRTDFHEARPLNLRSMHGEILDEPAGEGSGRPALSFGRQVLHGRPNACPRFHDLLTSPALKLCYEHTSDHWPHLVRPRGDGLSFSAHRPCDRAATKRRASTFKHGRHCLILVAVHQTAKWPGRVRPSQYVVVGRYVSAKGCPGCRPNRPQDRANALL